MMSAVVEEGCVFHSTAGLLVERLLVSHLIEAMVEMVGNITRMSEKLTHSLTEKPLPS